MTKEKVSFPAIFFSLIIVIVTWSLIEGWFPFARRKWLFLAVGMGFAAFANNAFFVSKRFFWLVVYLLVLLVNMMSGDKLFHDMGTIGYEFFCLGFPSVVATIILSNKSRKDQEIVLYPFLLVLIVTTVISFIIDAFILPNAIRMMTRYSITMGDMSTVYTYYKMGLSTYSFPHALPVLIPPIIMGIKNKTLSKGIRFFCWISLACLVILIYLSGIMTALLISIVALLMASVTKPGDLRRNIKSFIVIGFLMLPFLSTNIMGPLLHDAKMAVGEDSYYYNKLESFELSVINGAEEDNESDWGERKDLYSRSTEGFLNNILIGTNERVGGHSSILDRLGLLGIVGFVPFLIFVILQMRFSGRYLSDNSRIYYYEGFLVGVLMLALKSSLQVETLVVLFAILPIATSYLSSPNSQIDGRQ